MKKLECIKRVMVTVPCACLLLGSSIRTEAASYSKTIFDSEYYYNTYTDLQAAFGYDETALYNHYIQFGIKEGRSGSEEFNCSVYAGNYADLREVFGTDFHSYCMHYEQHGQSEERNAVTKFADAVEVELTGELTVARELGGYSTKYNPAINRSINLRVACSRIDGVVIQPGEEFSFSRTILPRTAANGYVKAKVIVNKEYVEGYGGGICQVSSTLYNAMLAAGIPATERHSHSLEVSYVPAGRDATISGTYKDLKFKNIFEKPVQIKAVMDDTTGTMTISLLEMDA